MNKRLLVDCPLGTRFRYLNSKTDQIWILIDRVGQGCGLIAEKVSPYGSKNFQSFCSAVELSRELPNLEVEVIE